jgi:hypothetical protein
MDPIFGGQLGTRALPQAETRASAQPAWASVPSTEFRIGLYVYSPLSVQTAGVSPWRRITPSAASTSGGPSTFMIAASSRK